MTISRKHAKRLIRRGMAIETKAINPVNHGIIFIEVNRFDLNRLDRYPATSKDVEYLKAVLLDDYFAGYEVELF